MKRAVKSQFRVTFYSPFFVYHSGIMDHDEDLFDCCDLIYGQRGGTVLAMVLFYTSKDGEEIPVGTLY